ncbi:MAG TPA: glycosyltransferase family 4 protein, partial [Flavobacterium sp.]|nr:glycosyltransferase family 4 protein [Flavobacterium sp.]
MKIAFIGQKGIPVSQGGVERHVEEIARRLAARGHTVLAYSRKTYAKGDSILPANIKVIDLPSVPLKAWDSIVHVMLSSIDVLFRDVDVIHYQSMGPAFFMVIPWLFKPKARLVFTHHTFEKQRPQWGMLSKLSMALGEWVGVHLADRVIATGSIIADDLKARYGRPVEVIVNGGTFNATKSDTALELPQKYILAVSRLISSKGLDHLINAFNLIAADYPLYHLVIVGSATHNDNVEPELRALAADNHKIHFLGQQPSSALG